MKKERVCTWFLEPKNSYSNEILVKGLGGQSDESLLFDVLCNDGRKHSLIRCIWSYVSKAQKSFKTDQNLLFKVWCKEGNGAIKPWQFDRPRPKRVKIPQKPEITKISG